MKINGLTVDDRFVDMQTIVDLMVQSWEHLLDASSNLIDILVMAEQDCFCSEEHGECWVCEDAAPVEAEFRQMERTMQDIEERVVAVVAYDPAAYEYPMWVARRLPQVQATR